jgi:predicted lactoylglutathione lyase
MKSTSKDFPAAVPEIPVKILSKATGYYERSLGFTTDWGRESGGIAQVSRGSCRLFLTNDGFRKNGGLKPPVVIWINLNSKAEVDALHEAWNDSGARILSKPQSQPWNLHEFLAADLDGNQLRVFYDFAWELQKSGGQ